MSLVMNYSSLQFLRIRFLSDSAIVLCALFLKRLCPRGIVLLGEKKSFSFDRSCQSTQRHREARCWKPFIYPNGTKNRFSKLAKYTWSSTCWKIWELAKAIFSSLKNYKSATRIIYNTEDEWGLWALSIASSWFFWKGWIAFSFFKKTAARIHSIVMLG